MRLQIAVSLLLLSTLSNAHAAESRLVKTQFLPAQRSSSPEQTAREFITAEAKSLGINSDSLVLIQNQSSLTANHLIFQQTIGDVPVENATFTVSVAKKNGAVFQYYNSALNSLKADAFKAKVSVEQAYDAAWAYVGVQERLYQAPKAKLLYKQTAKNLRLIYQIELSPTNPYGAFAVDVDASTGEILGVKDLRLTEKVIALPKTFGTKRPTIDRKQAFQAYKDSAPTHFVRAGETKSGNATVFDPDPKTFLNTDNLKDSSKASDFDAAYVERILPDLNFANGTYTLSGPWVKLIDFDPPKAAVSTTKNGLWSFKRGQSGFNDAMTYFHLDQSQRYIQSLGFKEENGIQFGPIEVDADGVNGDDNSYFQWSTNQLSFGHGCVDDNEDADVILHEYGHALHFSINANWGGGDSGAMGEGFGDYWAASYSYSTDNGKDFQSDIVYNWDAGTCWDGRVLNAIDARYDHSKSYYAHSGIAGGFQSDELWSTPLFQAHKQLRAKGIPREEIDTIVLEAQFGLGSGLKMRDMATSIVATAQRLYEKGPHAQVFRDRFVEHGILVLPRPILTAELGAVTDEDGTFDPGESVIFPLTIKNTGDQLAEAVTVEVTTGDEFVTQVQGSFTPGNLAAGKETSLNLGLTVSETAPCGHSIELQIRLKDKTGKEWTVTTKVQLGRALKTAISSEVNKPIPDKNAEGLLASVAIDSSAKVSSAFNVAVNIKHTYRADLKIVLTAPSGKKLTLHDRSGYSEDDIIGVYPTTLTPKDPLSSLIGENLNGNWSLNVADGATGDTGTLVSWGIEDVSGYECR